ncbi:MAG TPA: ABC transporter substrate-binding protein, partial [Aggregatilineales bacterium]|nr:ABC transporter substrate-binding protein [Aggregatilineales bacterium]
ADGRGYFAEEGIQLEVQTTVGGAEPLAPLGRGELDVILGGTGAGFFNYADRVLETDGAVPFRIVSPAHLESPPMTTSLVVSKERFDSGEITGVADLEGGRVSINAAGAGTEYWLYRALEAGGLTMGDVEIVPVAFGDVPAALNSGAEDRIDAAMLGEPVTSGAEAQGVIVRLSDDFLDGYQGTFVYMSTDFLENQRDVAVRFMKAFLLAARDLQDPAAWREDDIVSILGEKTLGYSADLLDLYAFPYFEANGATSVENIEAMQDYFMESGGLAYEESLDIAGLIDATIVEDALAEIGEYESMEAE